MNKKIKITSASLVFGTMVYAALAYADVVRSPFRTPTMTIGSSNTSSDNVKLHRGASGLQAVPGDDATAEGVDSLAGSKFVVPAGEAGPAGNSTNLLTNGDFEAGTTANWTASAGTFAASGTHAFEGAFGAQWDATANTDTLETDLYDTPAGWETGDTCLVSFRYSTDTGYSSGDHTFRVEDDLAESRFTAINLEPTGSLTTWYTAQAAYPCSADARTNKIVIEATTDAVAIRIDKAWMGDDYRIGETNQATLSAWIPYAPSTGMDGVTGETASEFRYSHQGKDLLIKGKVQFAGAATTNVRYPIAGLLPSGFTKDDAGWILGGSPTAPTGTWQLYDSSAPSNSNQYVGVTTITTVAGGDYVGFLNDQEEFDAASPFVIASGDILSFDVRIPVLEGNTSDQTVTLETQGWGVAGRFITGSPSLGTADTLPTYSEISDTGLSIEANSGSSPVRIGCAIPNPPIGNDCGGNNESVAINFDVPLPGKYKVLMKFNHRFQNTAANDDFSQYFKLVETSETSASILQEPAKGQYRRVKFGAAGANAATISLDGIFVFSSPGSKTIRVLGTTLISQGTIINNRFDCDTSTPDRQCYFEVIPITQNFTQAVAIATVPRAYIHYDSSSGTSLTHSVDKQMDFNQKVIDEGCVSDCVSTGAGTWFFTAPRDGFYWIKSIVSLPDDNYAATNGGLLIGYKVNGTGFDNEPFDWQISRGWQRFATGTSHSIHAEGSSMVKLQANDTLHIILVLSNGGGSLTTNTGNSTYIQIAEMGDGVVPQ